MTFIFVNFHRCIRKYPSFTKEYDWCLVNITQVCEEADYSLQLGTAHCEPRPWALRACDWDWEPLFCLCFHCTVLSVGYLKHFRNLTPSFIEEKPVRKQGWRVLFYCNQVCISNCRNRIQVFLDCENSQTALQRKYIWVISSILKQITWKKWWLVEKGKKSRYKQWVSLKCVTYATSCTPKTISDTCSSFTVRCFCRSLGCH